MSYSRRNVARMLTVEDLAQRFSVSRATAYRMAHELPMVRVGRCLRISEEALEEALKENDGELFTSSRQEEDRDERC